VPNEQSSEEIQNKHGVRIGACNSPGKHMRMGRQNPTRMFFVARFILKSCLFTVSQSLGQLSNDFPERELFKLVKTNK